MKMYERRKHDHSDGKDGEISGDISQPAAKGVRAREDVLKKDQRREDDLDDDADVCFEELEDKFYNEL